MESVIIQTAPPPPSQSIKLMFKYIENSVDVFTKIKHKFLELKPHLDIDLFGRALVQDKDIMMDLTEIVDNFKAMTGQVSLNDTVVDQGAFYREIHKNKYRYYKVRFISTFIDDTDQTATFMCKFYSALENVTHFISEAQPEVQQQFIKILEGIAKALKILIFNSSQFEGQVYRHMLVNYAFNIQDLLFLCYSHVKDYVSAKITIIEKQHYRSVMDNIQRTFLKQNRKSPFLFREKERFEEQSKLMQRNHDESIMKIFLEEDNLRDALKFFHRINDCLDYFSVERNINYVPLDIMRLTVQLAEKLKNINDIENAIVIYQLSKEYSSRMLQPKVKGYGTDFMDLDYKQDYPEFKEIQCKSVEGIFDLAPKYNPILLQSFSEEFIAEIIAFSLVIKLKSPLEENMEIFRNILNKNNIKFSEENNSFIIKPFFDLRTHIVHNMINEFKKQIDRKQAVQQILSPTKEAPTVKVSEQSSYVTVYESMSSKPSRQSRKSAHKKVNVVKDAIQIVEEKKVSVPHAGLNNEELTEIEKSLNLESGLSLISNDCTGTQFVAVDWSKINENALSSKLTAPIRNKLNALLKHPYITGEKGSGLKIVKGKYREQGFFMKAKVGEDVELLGKPRQVKTQQGRTLVIYEFNTVVDHKQFKK